MDKDAQASTLEGEAFAHAGYGSPHAWVGQEDVQLASMTFSYPRIGAHQQGMDRIATVVCNRSRTAVGPVPSNGLSRDASGTSPSLVGSFPSLQPRLSFTVCREICFSPVPFRAILPPSGFRSFDHGTGRRTRPSLRWSVYRLLESCSTSGFHPSIPKVAGQRGPWAWRVGWHGFVSISDRAFVLHTWEGASAVGHFA